MRTRTPSPRRGGIGLALIFTLVTGSAPALEARAALVGTEAVLASGRAETLRQEWLSSLEREDVRRALTARGIDPDEASQRLAHLTDAEVVELAEHLETLPAGRGAGTVIVAVVLVFALLIVLDAVGVTDVFPWVEAKP